MKVACVQLSPGDDVQRNLDAARRKILNAAEGRAQLIATPEFSVFLHRSGRAMREASFEEADHPALPAYAEFAREANAWLLLGSTTIITDGATGKLANRSFLFSASGEVVARYDKIHMFDATLPNGRSINESKNYRAGQHAVVVDTPVGKLGLSICYDLRFAYLYRRLAQEGAEILLVPSAFAQSTGEAHWHALIRARAIETGCYVIAPATCGTHPGNWPTYGHSLIVDPWGRIIAEAGKEPSVLLAEIDVNSSAQVRATMPSLTHDREFRTSHITV